MTDDGDDIAAALNQIVDIGAAGAPPRAADLAAAVSRHVSARPGVHRQRPDDEAVAALRAQLDPPAATGELNAVTVPCLSVVVDFNDLLDALGEPGVWTILGKLKDLFG